MRSRVYTPSFTKVFLMGGKDHGHRSERHGRNLRAAAGLHPPADHPVEALTTVGGHGHGAAGGGSLGSERLADGDVLIATDNAPHGCELGVLPGDVEQRGHLIRETSLLPGPLRLQSRRIGVARRGGAGFRPAPARTRRKPQNDHLASVTPATVNCEPGAARPG